MRSLILAIALTISACSSPSKPFDSAHALYTVSNQAVVKVVSPNGSGSAVIISPNHALTALHVVDDMPEGTEVVVTTQGGAYISTAYVVRRSTSHDLAVLELADRSPHFMPMSSAMPSEMSQIHTVGFPLGKRLTVTDGRYQGEVEAGMHAISTPIIFGNSGGPVIWFDHADMRYEVVGIAVAVRGAMGGPVPHMGLMHGLDSIVPLLVQI